MLQKLFKMVMHIVVLKTMCRVEQQAISVRLFASLCPRKNNLGALNGVIAVAKRSASTSYPWRMLPIQMFSYNSRKVCGSTHHMLRRLISSRSWSRSANSVLKKSKNHWPSILGGGLTEPTKTPSIIAALMFTLNPCWKVLSRTA
ncbi:unnamed protein product [Acanthoscelides obtectus]|uniref:Uncharacterized protein n=1 Tax=Acanthoscelides obtectus TaxID=200917 RepID=A0A9P0P798_ACAOB|nr:unnamed protein product [Acanthoscelides obtectus]CAK1635054.1 hypothetical protein AOBTE_LOCUS9029 [Acanthoscelides obtectus]